MQTSEDKVRAMDKIRKLLAMAAGQANENEAAIAAGQAEKMMRKYQIDFAELTLQEIEQDESFSQAVCDVSFEGIKGYHSKQVPSWVGYISIGCGEAFTCMTDIVNTPNGVKIRFSGYMLDVELCKWVFQFLCENIYRIGKVQMKGAGMAAAKGFRLGAASEVQRRLYALKRERDQENKVATVGTGLVIYDRKEARVQEMYGETRKRASNSTVSDRSAYMAGREAGATINIPTNRGVGSSNNYKQLH